MKKTTTYHLLTVDDAELFRTIRLRAIKEEPSAFLEAYEEIAEKPPEYFRRYFDNGWIVGAFIDGELKGITGLFRHKGIRVQHKGTVWGVYVSPEARGIGCGHRMIEILLEKAQEAGIEQVLLSTDANNPITVKLYESLHFMPYGIEKHMIKMENHYIDEIMMVRFLNEEGLRDVI